MSTSTQGTGVAGNRTPALPTSVFRYTVCGRPPTSLPFRRTSVFLVWSVGSTHFHSSSRMWRRCVSLPSRPTAKVSSAHVKVDGIATTPALSATRSIRGGALRCLGLDIRTPLPFLTTAPPAIAAGPPPTRSGATGGRWTARRARAAAGPGRRGGGGGASSPRLRRRAEGGAGGAHTWAVDTEHEGPSLRVILYIFHKGIQRDFQPLD